MATRHNLCPNPALGTNVTGWGGGSTPSRVTGVSGFPTGVTTAARYVANNYIQTPTAPITPGTSVTVSLYVTNNAAFNSGNKTVYLAFTRSGSGDDFSQTKVVTFALNVTTRINISGVAPANATGVYLVIDTVNGSLGTGFDISAALYESISSLDSYFDGNSSGASWDGTANNSASTLPDTPSGPTATVWNGTSEVAVSSITIWNGTSEVAAMVESIV